jgi:hypothetical protein
MDFASNEFGLQRPSASGRPAPTGKGFCVGGGRRLAWSAWRGRFQSAWAPLAGGQPARRMNSASRGLRPMVGLRRPEKASLRRRRPTLGAERPWRPISIGVRACADRKNAFCVGGGRRLARSALRGRFQSARRPLAGGRPGAPNEFGLQRPSANGRPAPTEKMPSASAEADAWRVSACGGRFQSALGVTQLGPNWVIPTAICGVFWPITRHIWGSLPANCVSPTA